MSASSFNECTTAFITFSEVISYINLENIYAPLCLSSNLIAQPKKASVSIDRFF